MRACYVLCLVAEKQVSSTDRQVCATGCSVYCGAHKHGSSRYGTLVHPANKHMKHLNVLVGRVRIGFGMSPVYYPFEHDVSIRVLTG